MVKTRLKRMQYRPRHIQGLITQTGPDCNHLNPGHQDVDSYGSGEV
jgi:hypothetical protein